MDTAHRISIMENWHSIEDSEFIFFLFCAYIDIFFCCCSVFPSVDVVVHSSIQRHDRV